MAEQDVDHHLEVLVERDDHLLRRMALAHRREPADVGEQHGHVTAGAALVEGQLPGDDLVDQVRREQALELGAGGRLVLDLLRQHVVLDGDRGLRGDAREQEQVLLRERAGRQHRVHVHGPEQLVVVEQRHAHRRADALHDDALGRLEALVDHRVRRQHGALFGAHLVEDALGQLDLLVALLPDVARDEVVGLRVEQEDDGPVGADQQEGLVDDLLQQGVEVGVDRELLRELVGDAQLLVVGAQDRDVLDVLLGQEPRVGRQCALDLALDLVRRHRHLADRQLVLRPVLGEAIGRVAERDLIAGLQRPLADLLSVDEGAVEAADITNYVATVGSQRDPAVLLRHDAVEDLDRVVWMASKGIKRREDVLDRMIPSEQDELRCHRQFGIVGQQTRRINQRYAGRALLQAPQLTEIAALEPQMAPGEWGLLSVYLRGDPTGPFSPTPHKR